MITVRLHAVLAVSLLLATIPLAADVLILEDGKQVVGEVTESGNTYAVKTKYGTLSVPKSSVRKIIPAPDRIVAKASQLRAVAGTMVKEAAAVSDETARNAKLDAAIALLDQARQSCVEARAAYTGPEGEELAKIVAAIDGEIGQAREKLGGAPAGATLTPPPPPPAPSAIARPPHPIPAKPTPATPAKLPEPDAAARKAAEKQVREIFRADFARRSTQEMADFARRLIREGVGAENDPAARYVLLREALDLAVRAGETETALRAIEALDRFYVIEAVEEKMSVLGKAERKARTIEAGRALADQYMALMDEAEQAEQYAVAIRAGERAKTMSRSSRDPALTARAQERIGAIRDLQREAAAVAPHLKKLETDPDDAAANAEAGTFYCLSRGDWEKGLPMLARGSDETLRALAEKEQAGPTARADVLALADAWWTAGDRKSGKTRLQYRGRAVHWYERALPDLEGLTRTRVEKRLAEGRKSLASLGPGAGQRTIDVIRLVDPRKHTIAGTWEVKGGQLLLTKPSEFARIRFPVIPRGSYDVEVRFTRSMGNRSFGLILPVGDHGVVATLSWNMNNGRWFSGLNMIKGKLIPDNPTGRPGEIEANRAYTFLVRVRHRGSNAVGIEALLDGRPYFAWSGMAEDLSQERRSVIRRPVSLGWAANQDVMTFHSIRLRMITGKAEFLR